MGAWVRSGSTWRHASLPYVVTWRLDSSEQLDLYELHRVAAADELGELLALRFTLEEAQAVAEQRAAVLDWRH